MSRLFKALIAPVWLCLSILNAGFVNAYFRADFPLISQDERWTRQNLAFAIGWSLLPPAWVITPFVTGFYQDGWTLSSKPVA